jgi:hypothetical protein
MLSPDSLLTAACCSWPPSDERAASIRAAAQDIADWDRFLTVVKTHRVAVQVRQALRASAIGLPFAIVGELDALVQRSVRHGLKLAAETARLQNLLTAAGIPSLVLKGVAIEQLAYGAIGVKQTRDIDLLVPPEHAEIALQTIERDGYTLSLPAKTLNDIQRRGLIRYAREVELSDPLTKVRVELQWRAADNPILLSGVDAQAPSQTVALSEGASVRTLSSDDLFAYLCVHGARHSWSRLKWLTDVNALIVSSNADIERLYRHAQKIGAGLCAGQALLLCQRLLGLEIPTNLAEEMQTNKRCRKLLTLAMEALAAPVAAGESDPGLRGVVRELRYQFLLGQGLRFYATQCRLACTGTADIVRLPLPWPLHFIYPLVRLPMWLWRRVRAAWAPPRLRPE